VTVVRKAKKEAGERKRKMRVWMNNKTMSDHDGVKDWESKKKKRAREADE
jgi:hypothetical protein